MPAELETIHFESVAALRSWLEANHETSPGIWVQMAKKGTGRATITWDDLVDEGLCFGWIDGQRGALDETYFVQRFTPRTKRSKWSKINTDRVARLIKAKRMRPAGLRQVELAKADGRWDAAYEGSKVAEVPDDLQAALDASPAAAEAFAGLDRTNRYAILYRIGAVKRPETRARKIGEFVAMLERGDTVHPRSRT
jgi:uncharacterized protein YdeI (YjbR/CyaY-like superfamily)